MNHAGKIQVVNETRVSGNLIQQIEIFGSLPDQRVLVWHFRLHESCYLTAELLPTEYIPVGCTPTGLRVADGPVFHD